jgi:hypothetical protein
MDRSSRLAALFLFSLIIRLTSLLVLAADVPRTITIMNESGRRVEIYWISPDDGELVLQSDPEIPDGTSLELNSFVGHSFEVRELPGKKSGVCDGEGQTCRVDYFTVNPNNDQSEIIVKDVCSNDESLLSLFRRA